MPPPMIRVTRAWPVALTRAAERAQALRSGRLAASGVRLALDEVSRRITRTSSSTERPLRAERSRR